MNVEKLPITLQGFFDNAWQWAVVEEHQRCTSGGRAGALCAYRDANGNRCLFGVSIPDADYRSGMEGHTVDFVLANYFAGAGVPLHCVAPLRTLQHIHDNHMEMLHGPYWSYVRRELTKFANLNELTIPDFAE